MHRQTTKQHTNVNECYNSLNALDLQAIVLFAFIKQRHAHQLLMAAITIDLQDLSLCQPNICFIRPILLLPLH